jgi:hypothetical protein
MLLVEVLVADVTSSRSRLLFSYVPALPFIVSAMQAPITCHDAPIF